MRTALEDYLTEDERRELRTLKRRERRLRRQLNKGLTIVEVAKNINISPSYVSLIERTALRKIRLNHPELNPNKITK